MSLLLVLIAVESFVVGLLVLVLIAKTRRPFTRGETHAWDQNDAAGFLASGGRFTLDEWLAMGPETRAVVTEIARVLDADRMVSAALAGQSKEAAAALYSIVDGGKAAQESVMEETMARTAEKFRRKVTGGRLRVGDR